jgi:hypothetical protein
MISSSEHPRVRGSFECSDQPEPEPSEHEILVRARCRKRRADRETLRDIGPPCSGYVQSLSS